MAITMQGSWTVTVAAKSAAFAQRLVVSRPGQPDLVVAGLVGNAVFVSAAQWSINVQSQAGAGQPWIDSAQRITFPTVSGNLLRFNINTDDSGGDGDYNDLVLTCTMPVSASEFVVYGSAKTYSGFCRWNPCYPWYYVIETAAQLRQALEIPALRAIIAKLYPQRVPKRPGPPDPGPLFSPILLPKAGPVANSGFVFRSAATGAPQPEGEIDSAEAARRFDAAAADRLKGSASLVTFDGSPVSAGAALLDQAEMLTLAKLADRFKILPFCDVEPAPGLLLRFQEYDRTDAEKAGGPYTAAGSRENLGLAATDELGNYIFRFSRSLADLADEALDVGAGEMLSTQIFPDVIVQALSSSLDVEFETAPHYNIPNLVRIDLCMPYGSVHPSNPKCTEFDRIITRIGDIVVLHSAIGGSPNTLTADGRITCRNVNAPQVDCAAWRNFSGGGRVGLSLYACMTYPEVASYTLRYNLDNVWTGPGANWQFVIQSHKLIFVPLLGTAGYTGSSVGPINRAVHLDGGAATSVPTYDNHGNDTQWIENDLKMVLDTTLYRAASNPGPVYFRIQGYDAAGNLVAGVDDTIPLYIANRASTGHIAAVDLGVPADDDCTLLDLPDGSPNAPVFVKYQVENPDGFLQSWGLSVTRGNNHAVPVTASGVVPTSYPVMGLPDCQFHGTPDFPTDLDGNTVTQLVPASGNWLPADRTFCAFAFTLTASDRVTDGRSAYWQTVFWQDLVGIDL
ncbi:MAG TPA: hypothetical protein VGF34_17765 [Stellaceae bacterium]